MTIITTFRRKLVIRVEIEKMISFEVSHIKKEKII